MDAVLLEVLKSAPSSNDPILKLRSKFIGSRVDISKLPEHGFIRIEDSSDGWMRWVKYINKKSYRLLMNVAPSGTICMIRFSTFIDLQNSEGLGAPYGWYQFNEISPKNQKKITDELNSIVVEFPAEDKDELFCSHFRKLNFDYKKYDQSIDELIGALANNYYNEEQYSIMSILTYSIYNNLGKINEPNLLLDLPFLCGRLQLENEFYQAISKIIECEIGVSSTAYTNIGAVLCDEFNVYDLATECFKTALNLQPNLEQAKQNLLVSSKNQIRQLLSEQNIDEAIKLGEEIIQITNNNYDHGFYSYLGLAYEISGDLEKADKYYSSALRIDKECSISSDRLSSLRKKPYDPREALRTLERIRLSTQYRNLTKEFMF